MTIDNALNVKNIEDFISYLKKNENYNNNFLHYAREIYNDIEFKDENEFKDAVLYNTVLTELIAYIIEITKNQIN